LLCNQNELKGLSIEHADAKKKIAPNVHSQAPFVKINA
jgi:hypothetical protein